MSHASTLPEDLPLFPLGGAILLPGERLPLNVFEPRYLNMVDDVRAGDGHIGIIQVRPGGSAAQPALAATGTAGRLDHFEETDDGRYLITLTGISRFAVVEELDTRTPYRIARADYRPFAADLEPRQEVAGDRDRLIRMLQAWFQSEQVVADWESVAEAPLVTVVDQLSMSAPFGAQDRQRLLEAADSTARLGVMETILAERLAGGAGGSVQ